MATGTVTQRDPLGSKCIVLIDGGGHAVFDLLGTTDIAVGDRVSGELNAVGLQELLHLPDGQVLKVFGQTGASNLKVCEGQFAD